ncbi:MAG: ATP synthase F1 subunit gamma [Eubacterium sp.]|nr:ATP synthase F1 subunit gamma [Eubacterium sp.]MCR4846010.1 ATP synthase F1 subunit gamma [Eubacterium sp.]
MANTKEIKNRIASVKNTQKITSAMYLISSTKMRKAKEELDRSRPYFDMQEHEIRRIFQSEIDIRSRYFYPKTGRRPAETYAYLIITADKGLAGAYNHNVLKMAEEEMKKHKRVKLYVVGEYGRRYFYKRNVHIEQSFLYTAQNPNFSRAREICSILLEEYDEKRVDEIRIIYSDMENELVSTVKMMRLLPFDRKEFWTKQEEKTERDIHYEFYPSVDEVLNRVIKGYVAGCIYGALVDSFSAEQNARMTAMNSANKNAEELLAELQVQYNRVRQAAITQEITEVAAGAKGQKRKRVKEAAES